MLDTSLNCYPVLAANNASAPMAPRINHHPDTDGGFLLLKHQRVTNKVALMSTCKENKRMHPPSPKKSYKSATRKADRNSQKQKYRVRFVEYTSIRTYTPDPSQQRLWYTPHDYCLMRARDTCLLQLLRQGSAVETTDITAHGLERQICPSKQRYESIDAVLGEQERQDELNICNPDLLAYVYFQARSR